MTSKKEVKEVKKGEKRQKTKMKKLEKKLIWKLGKDPIKITCPNCKHLGYTNVENRITNTMWLTSGIMCLVFWPLVCLPCCVMQPETHHYCDNCDVEIKV